jgi:CHAT domain-containing protein
VLRRKNASESWLKSAQLSQYAVVHFATHALVDDGSLSNTALALAPGGSEDGFLHAGELANLELNADLVILSACRTAGGAIVRGEGVQGLAAPLLAAGARAIAATWWPIGDVATLEVVDDFYRAMADGRNAGDALHSAKLAALRRGAPPRDWAAFTLVGDPFARPPLRPATLINPTWRWVALAAVVAALIYGAVMRRRRVGEARVPSGRTATTHQR